VGKKILLVDDEVQLSDLVKIRLEAYGFEVVAVYDGQEGLNKAKEIKPDLVILDLMLPKIDGYKVCRMLKFDDKYKHIPIILFTAKAQDDDKKIGEQVKADAYITKPFEPEVLMSKVKELLKM
jgi:DNA-binding response OmpR family regulator